MACCGLASGSSVSFTMAKAMSLCNFPMAKLSVKEAVRVPKLKYTDYSMRLEHKTTNQYKRYTVRLTKKVMRSALIT